MKTIWKRMALIVSILCLALGCAAFAACGETETPAKTTYSVKVVLADGTTPVVGAQVTFCFADGSNCKIPLTTNAEGVASQEYDTNEYLVHVINVPADIKDGYKTEEEGTYYANKDGKYLTSGWNGSSYTYVLVAAE